MFSNPTAIDTNFDEGTITQVDPLRRACKVKTSRGQNLEFVTWTETVGGSSRSGFRKGPRMGDRVQLFFGLGYPLITGFLPRLQSTDVSFPVNIDSGQALLDTGDYSNGSSLATSDVNKPNDILNGDQIITSEGGGLIGVLRAGAVVIKSSKLSQIFLSKLDDVIKVISRNWEHYTDVNSDIIKNLLGRVYRYTGYSHLYGEAKIENYRYHLYYGDVSLAEAVKTNYLSPSSTPTQSNVIFKEQITDSIEKMHRTLNLAGEEHLKITGSGILNKDSTGSHEILTIVEGGNISRESTAAHEILTVTNGTYSKRTTTAATTIIDFNGQNTITVNDPVIELRRSDGSSITLNSGGITITFNGCTSTYTASGMDMNFGGHFVRIKSTGVELG